jgi:hypothetical protein
MDVAVVACFAGVDRVDAAYADVYIVIFMFAGHDCQRSW